MKKIILIFILILIDYSVFSQESNYIKSFEWMVKTFEENDAGFKYIVEEKGVNDYTRHNSTCREKILQAKTEEEYLSIMNNWLFYFRKGHIGIFPQESINQNNNSDFESETTKDSIRRLYQNEACINLDEAEFIYYLKKNQYKINPIEGVWRNESYTIGIVRSKNNVNKFDAFIIKADSIFWIPKQKKAELTLLNDSTFGVMFFMHDHSKEKTNANYVGKSYGIISMVDGFWIKTYPKVNYPQKDQIFLEYAFNSKPFIRKLNEKTIYLRIPSFQYSEKTEIDNLLFKNDSLIKATRNLIIDIRNGTGGSDLSYYNLIPYFYTQPIRRIGMKYRATELNANAFESYSKLINDTAIARVCNDIANKMRQHLGNYIDVGDKGVSIDSSYTFSKYPIKVAVIFNKNNGSTDEGFLYDIRQSCKVKLFGRPTGGMFDFSNMNFVDFPNSTYRLGYTMTATKRLPDYKIDGVGIQPDYFIDDSIKEEDWIEFVQSVIEVE